MLLTGQTASTATVSRVIDTVVVDYGGVLTNPLPETLGRFAQSAGVTAQDILAAMEAATARYGHPPMADLEVGAISEWAMVNRIFDELPVDIADVLGGRPFGEVWFRHRTPNEPFNDFLQRLHKEGYRLALLTNNVLEWKKLWQPQVPLDLFSVVVNSAEEGVRKPGVAIYRILLDRLKADPEQCLFVDDTAENLRTAEALGMSTVHFQQTSQAEQAIRAALEAQS
jgi:putative hydrolase of the HAD superfamily